MPTSLAFWHASASIVEAVADLLEPSTYEEAVSGPNQVHRRKAIGAELASMKLRGVFRAAKMPSGQRAVGTKLNSFVLFPVGRPLPIAGIE